MNNIYSNCSDQCDDGKRKQHVSHYTHTHTHTIKKETSTETEARKVNRADSGK